jgi:hypothetical protein
MVFIFCTSAVEGLISRNGMLVQGQVHRVFVVVCLFSNARNWTQGSTTELHPQPFLA